jgi:multiple sugar transport system permease protein
LLAGRLSVPADLYEAARIDGASALQQFRYVTWPLLRNLYLTSTLLSTIFSLGDFNSVYLLTGGGPAELTHVLATLGIRYAFNIQELGLGMATVMVALPALVPLVILLVRWLGRPGTQ